MAVEQVNKKGSVTVGATVTEGLIKVLRCWQEGVLKTLVAKTEADAGLMMDGGRAVLGCLGESQARRRWLLTSMMWWLKKRLVCLSTVLWCCL